MTNSPYIRSAIAQATLELLPPLIREGLIEQSGFREEYGLTSDAVLNFGDSSLSIQRSALFDAIRKFFSGVSKIEVADMNEGKWTLGSEDEKGELRDLVISRDKQRFELPDFSALSPNRTVRLRFLDEITSHNNLPIPARDTWHNILSKHSLKDDEFHGFDNDIRDTPVNIARSIRNKIKNGRQIKVSSLVPSSRRYFERLVGAYDGSTSIGDYATGKGRQLFKQLPSWRPYEGFLFSLLLSSHSALTAEISVEHLENKELVRALDFLEKHGDRISQLGAIEVGLRILPERPEIEPALIRLIKQIRDDDTDTPSSAFSLLSALFILVDGELSRLRLLSKEPPFYRRLASLSHAALIQRQLVKSDIEIDHFSKWASSNREEWYYLQSLADMRLEPYWNPDYVAASQIKADFFGRIMIAAKHYEKNIDDGDLHHLILGTDPGSLHSLSEFPRPYFPGPLDGSNNPNRLPAELSEAIEKQLSAKKVEPSSFIVLLNSALFLHVESRQAELAAKALKLGNYRLANVKNRPELLAILNGLAMVAATTRNRTLADELRILVRRYRRDAHYALSIEEAIRVCLVAAASRTDLKDWREFVGNWFMELAFDELKSDDGNVLYLYLQDLCHVVPELWVSCGRADAALKSVIVHSSSE